MSNTLLTNPQQQLFGGDDFDQEQILVAMQKTLATIKEHHANTEQSDSVFHPTYSHGYFEKLVILHTILDMQDPVLTPVLNRAAPMGHIYPIINIGLALPLGEDFVLLEDLGDLGLLKRELHNHVNLCPRCHNCQINFRETCPTCGSIDIRIESLIHHFRCAYSGLESEFLKGIDLVCPKCRKPLFQLGQDFERPHETYLCHACHDCFEDAALSGQCLSCSHEFPGSEVDVGKIYRYRPTLLSVRAVELNRLTGLDVGEIIIDAHVKLATREFLSVETEREVYRLNRYGSTFSTAKLAFTLNDKVYPIFREWPVETIHQLGDLIRSYHRNLDIIARIDRCRIGLLLPETNAEGMVSLSKRVVGELNELALLSSCGNPLGVQWIDATWSDKKTKTEQVLNFFEEQDEQE